MKNSDEYDKQDAVLEAKAILHGIGPPSRAQVKCISKVVLDMQKRFKYFVPTFSIFIRIRFLIFKLFIKISFTVGYFSIYVW